MSCARALGVYVFAFASACTPVRRDAEQEPEPRAPQPPAPSSWGLALDPGLEHHVLLFDYEDFGPQAMAFAFLGMQWHPWQDPLHEPLPPEGEDTPITVVVFDGVERARVERAFASAEASGRDARIVDAAEALAFLDHNIDDLALEEDALLVSLRERITATHRRIRDALRPTSSPARPRP